MSNWNICQEAKKVCEVISIAPPPQPHFKQNKFQSKGAGKGTKTKIAFNEMNDVFFYYVCRNQETFGFYSQLDAVHEKFSYKSLSKWNSFPTHGLAKGAACFPDIVSNESSSAKLIFSFWLVFNLCHLKRVDSAAISISDEYSWPGKPSLMNIWMFKPGREIIQGFAFFWYASPNLEEIWKSSSNG